MLSGLNAGATASHNVRVTPDMFARFDGKLIHPVYSTVSMVYHMEWVSRKIILPYLETDEEGMGGSVTVKHIAPCPEGAVITLTATLLSIKDNAVVTEVQVESCGQLVGIGKVKQVILPKAKITEMTSTV